MSSHFFSAFAYKYLIMHFFFTSLAEMKMSKEFECERIVQLKVLHYAS